MSPQETLAVAADNYRVNAWSLAGSAASTPAQSDAILQARAPIYRTSADKFRLLVAAWKRESQFLSSTADMAALDSYHQIINMRAAAIPLLLRELERSPDYWFLALETVSGSNPVSDEDRGRISLMRDAWLAWGRQHGHI